MSHDLSAPKPMPTSSMSKGLLAVVLLGIVTSAVFAWLMYYVWRQTPSNPFEMMK